MTVILAFLLMGPAASAASLFLKKSIAEGFSIKRLIVSPHLYFGGMLYVLSALLNLYLLKHLPYSIVVPLGSLTYIWTLWIAYKFLGEAITRQKIAGIILILGGVSLMAISI